MRRSLFPDDDSLPTWLHTLACFLVVSPFGVPLIWAGGKAVFLRYLEPIAGPEFGQFFFGSTALQGNEAVWAGLSLVVLGFAFFSIGARFTRAGRVNSLLHALPWVLLAVSIALGLPVDRHE